VAVLLKAGPRLDLAEKTVVCVITGHGLKDPETALAAQAESVAVASKPVHEQTLTVFGRLILSPGPSP
jgi:threonine synthase